MPWHIPEDFKFFKKTTLGHALIMGRKTFESIGRPLPGRLNVVVTRDPNFQPANIAKQGGDQLLICRSLDEAISLCQAKASEWGDEIFILGGGEIYRQTMGLVDRIYLTKVHQHVDAGDTVYPEIDYQAFTVESLQTGQEPIPYTIFKLDRRKGSSMS